MKHFLTYSRFIMPLKFKINLIFSKSDNIFTCTQTCPYYCHQGYRIFHKKTRQKVRLRDGNKSDIHFSVGKIAPDLENDGKKEKVGFPGPGKRWQKLEIYINVF